MTLHAQMWNSKRCFFCKLFEIRAITGHLRKNKEEEKHHSYRILLCLTHRGGFASGVAYANQSPNLRFY